MFFGDGDADVCGSVDTHLVFACLFFCQDYMQDLGLPALHWTSWDCLSHCWSHPRYKERSLPGVYLIRCMLNLMQPASIHTFYQENMKKEAVDIEKAIAYAIRL